MRIKIGEPWKSTNPSCIYEKKAKKITLIEVIMRKKYLCVWQKGLNEYCFLNPYVFKKPPSSIIIACWLLYLLVVVFCCYRKSILLNFSETWPGISLSKDQSLGNIIIFPVIPHTFYFSVTTVIKTSLLIPGHTETQELQEEGCVSLSVYMCAVLISQSCLHIPNVKTQ